MQFTKKQLEFLKVFQQCIDTSSFEGDKVNIIADKEKGMVYFTLFTEDVKLIESIKYEVTESFVLSIILSQFNSMMSFCKDDDIIEIENGKIKFGNNSEYEFETFDFNMDNFNKILEITLEGEILELKDIPKIERISLSIGNDSDTGCIAFQDNHFLTYNGDILSYIKTNNEIEENFYLPRIFYKLYQLYKFNSISLQKVNDKYFYMTIGTLKIFIRIAEYSIPYIFDEAVKVKFDHTKEIKVNKDSMKQALSRLKVLNQQTSYNRVFFTVKENEVHLEIKDDFKGKEIVSSDFIDESLREFYIICNTSFLYDIINADTEEDIIIKMESIEDLTTIKIENVKEDTNYVLTLYKKYNEEE